MRRVVALPHTTYVSDEVICRPHRIGGGRLARPWEVRMLGTERARSEAGVSGGQAALEMLTERAVATVGGRVVGAAVHCPSGPHTHSIADACALIGCDSEDWLIDRVRNGTFPARKVVRQVRFSDSDIATIIEACALEPKRRVTDPPIPTFTARSRRAGRRNP